jgi:hypothetical protein
MVAEVVPTKVADPGALEQFHPALLKSGRHVGRAAKAGELTENPVRRVDKPRINRLGKVRFLDPAEEVRLRNAMKARDVELQNLRTSGNARRQHRHEKLLPLLPHFGDHLTPAVLLS